jgi:hypothetical protein
MIAFGGFGSSGFTWEYDGATGTWTQMMIPGPSPRREQAMAYDPVRGVGVLYGGLSAVGPLTSLRDTWIWHSASGQWTEVNADQPAWRRLAGMGYDLKRERIVLFGGCVGQVAYADAWALESAQPGQWQPASQAPPLHPRSGSYVVYDSIRDVTVLFTRALLSTTSETWEWDGTRWMLRSTAGPSPRSSAAMVFDSWRGVTVLFGGSAAGASGETWEWDGQEWTLAATSGPPPRWSHAMAFDSARGVTVLFGGTVDNSVGFGDTWEWDGREWTQIVVSGPQPRFNCAAAYDSHRQVTVLFGGRNFLPPNIYYGNTWEFDGIAWGQVSSSFPTTMTFGAGMTFDSRRSVTVLLGERRCEWDGQQWSVAELDSTAVCNTSQVTYDIRRSSIVALDSKWPYSESFAALFEFAPVPGACPGDVNLDGTVDVIDLIAVILAWGACPPAPAPCPADVAPIGGDGQVDVDDLIAVVVNWS